MEDFVSYDIAVKLKEKGFREKCKKHCYPNSQDWFISSTPECDNFSNYLDIPTIYQVLKWLREEKKIHVEIDIMKAYPEYKLTYWGYNIVLIDKYEVYHFEWNSNSFEQAALAGIEYVLDNLI